MFKSELLKPFVETSYTKKEDKKRIKTSNSEKKGELDREKFSKLYEYRYLKINESSTLTSLTPFTTFSFFTYQIALATKCIVLHYQDHREQSIYM